MKWDEYASTIRISASYSPFDGHEGGQNAILRRRDGNDKKAPAAQCPPALVLSVKMSRKAFVSPFWKYARCRIESTRMHAGWLS